MVSSRWTVENLSVFTSEIMSLLSNMTWKQSFLELTKQWHVYLSVFSCVWICMYVYLTLQYTVEKRCDVHFFQWKIFPLSIKYVFSTPFWVQWIFSVNLLDSIKWYTPKSQSQGAYVFIKLPEDSFSLSLYWFATCPFYVNIFKSMHK